MANTNEGCIIIDYAHTPDAIFNIINTVKQFSKGKIYSIIGCGGDRDKSKRYKMTETASMLSDEVIVTSDNPRHEQLDDIISDMVTGLPTDNFKIIKDRKEAIEYGLTLLKPDDILLVLGKGHENYQIIGDEYLDHDDKQYVLKLIK